MKLNYITLRNFRQYCGEQTIQFATNNERHVTVIHGVNGAGKTSLCIALNWCLYGTEFISNQFGQIGELVSKHLVARISSGDTSVKVGFICQNAEYYAERKYVNQGKSSFYLKKVGSTPPYLDEDAEDRIQLMIPKEISVHFFFDGEKINNFALPESNKEVKDAVCNVLNIEAVQRGLQHLDKIAGNYNSELNKELKKQPGNELNILQNKKGELQKELTALIESVKEKEKEMAKAKKQIEDIDEELKVNIASQELAEDRKNTEEKLKQLKRRISQVEERIYELANHGYIPIAKPVLDKALEILIDKDIPVVTEPLLQGLLKQMRCLCGRPINPESHEQQIIQSMLKKISSAKSTTVLRETYSDLNYVSLSKAKDISRDLKLALTENQDLDREIDSHEAHLNKISKQLKGFKQVDIRRLQNDRDQCHKKIGGFEKDIQHFHEEIKKTDKAIDEVREQIKVAETSSNKVEKLKRYADIAEQASNAMKRIHALFAENMREKIEPIVEKIFKQLVWKSSSFQNVQLSSDFELQVIDKFGEQAKPELSAGERQVLSLAFILAMAQVAAEEMPLNMENEPYPILMDTPFGKLSEEPRKNITKTIPDIADQLILFVTDTELGNEARKNLDSRIGKEYNLQFDQEKSATNITTIL